MDNKNLNVFLIGVIIVLTGFLIIKEQARGPVLQAIVKNQNKIIETQKKVEMGIGSMQAVSNNVDSNQIKLLEARISVLENQIKTFQQAFDQAKAAVQRPSGPPPEDLNKVFDIPVGHSYVKGNKDAKVTLIEFSDIQCPFSARFHLPLNELAKIYPNDLKIIFKNFPLSFHKQAKSAAKAAFAAGEQGKYFEMIDALLVNQKELSDEKYKELAVNLGLDAGKFEKDYKENDAKWEQMIQDDIKLGSSSDVRGTPTFFINGKKTMARDIESYKKEINAILGIKK